MERRTGRVSTSGLLAPQTLRGPRAPTLIVFGPLSSSPNHCIGRGEKQSTQPIWFMGTGVSSNFNYLCLTIENLNLLILVSYKLFIANVIRIR